MQRDETFINTLNQSLREINFETTDGYEAVKNYFSGKDGWIAESKSCWSSRDKVARILPDGPGFKFEVWQVDMFPTLMYSEKLESNHEDFLKQAFNAGL